MTIPADVKNIHFIGIGGYGMSALALILLQKGYTVSGSDIKDSALTENLVSNGATVMIGHSAENLGDTQLVVYSTAIDPDNPELLETHRRGLPLWHRSELLASLLNSAYGIAIAGTHGKTTTTAMVALLLEAGGLDPTAVIGGVLPAYGSNARLGTSNYLVAEADESDNSFNRYHPRMVLVTGIEPDHLEHYKNNYELLRQAYETFLAHLHPDGKAIICVEEPGLPELTSRLDRAIITYARTNNSAARPDYYADHIKLTGSGSSFDIYYRGTLKATNITLNVPGSHNISNAVGALALADQLKVDLISAAPALSAFTGVGRRFEHIGTINEITVIDDYAHHPTEIKATLQAARLSGRRIICIFQPHRHTRTAGFFEEFARSFCDADRLLLHSIYPAGEKPIPGITSEALAAKIECNNDIPVFYSPDINILEEKAVQLARPGDLIITMGAGDITASARRIYQLLSAR
ncbi:MAG: UDP-N-acetylmuramate--L-alanine ligase [Bacillota bacterium]|nr:UDP-N-acetylmuramate--L-alanine ligase [Bacillota bacterium]